MEEASLVDGDIGASLAKNVLKNTKKSTCIVCQCPIFGHLQNFFLFI